MPKCNGPLYYCNEFSCKFVLEEFLISNTNTEDEYIYTLFATVQAHHRCKLNLWSQLNKAFIFFCLGRLYEHAKLRDYPETSLEKIIAQVDCYDIFSLHFKITLSMN